MAEPPFSRIGIVGLGLIGGSIAQRARLVWPEATIVGIDRPEEMAAAVQRGIVHETGATLASLSAADLIVLATPVESICQAMPALAALKGTAVITDVGSTKRQVVAAAAGAGLTNFVGGHPMAGSERAGLDYARPDMFEGRPWLLVAGGAAAGACARVENFARCLGAVTRWVDADAHDRAVAYVSHLPQIISVALMNAASEAIGEEGLGAAGRAFAEMTRLANSPPELWQGILGANADFAAEAVARFVASLPTRDDLAGREWVRDAFARASEARPRRLGDEPAKG